MGNKQAKKAEAKKPAASVGTKDAAKLLGVSQRALQRMVKEGKLKAKAHDAGTRRLYSIAVADVEKAKKAAKK